jgi:hypothetical protein
VLCRLLLPLELSSLSSSSSHCLALSFFFSPALNAVHTKIIQLCYISTN